MTTLPQRWLVGFGVFLIACGFIGWAASGFSAYARTAILSGSACGASMIAAGWLAGRPRPGMRNAGLWAGRILPLLFLGVFAWRATVAWRDWSDGKPKLYVAVLLTLMAAASAITAAVLWRSRVSVR